MAATKRYSPEVREWAVRLVFEHQHEHASQWAAIVSVSSKFGMVPQT
jgi:transposase